MTAYIVIKRDVFGNEVLRYCGIVHERGKAFVCIDATFALADRDLGYIQLRRGDCFREWFYADRWFNIFRVQDVDTLEIKGWYCNITRPPMIEAGQVAADDLALDLFVDPDGRTLLLDEEDFAQLELPSQEQKKARQAVESIKLMVENRLPPFDEIRAS